MRAHAALDPLREPPFGAWLFTLWGALSFGAGCQSQNSMPHASSSVSVPAPLQPESEPTVIRHAEPWVEWLRAEDYQRAALEFDRQHAEPHSPELRLARAKMAFELGEYERVLVLTEGLAEELPFMRDETARWHWLARAEHAPNLEVARHFSSGASLDDRLLGVRLLTALGAFDEALAVSEALVARADAGKRSALARVRRARADLHAELASKGEQAAQQRHLGAARADYEWLSLEASSEPAALGADERLESLGRRLSKRERFARAEKLTAAGDIDAVERELRLMNDAEGPAPKGVAVLRTRAWAYFKSRRDYAKAAELFQQCAELDADHRVQDSFYAARALSRANRDEEAIHRYEEIARRYPESSYAEEARFLAARLHFVLGHWQHAERAFTQYLERVARKRDQGRFAASARKQRALAQLAQGRGGLAEAQLSSLVNAERDAGSKAMLSQLHALALLQQGKSRDAERAFLGIIEQRPLSMAALLSAERLRELGVASPPIMPRRVDVPAVDVELSALGATVAPSQWSLPPDVARLSAVGLDQYAERLLRSHADVFKRDHSPRGGEALCSAYGMLGTARERFKLGQSVVRERALMRPLSDATRWLWECNYPRPYLVVVEESASRHAVPSSLVYAVMRQESAFAPKVGSSAGAVGLMQLIQPTAERAAEELGIEPGSVDRQRPATNIRLGTFYLGRLLKVFGGNAPLAAAGYNAGPGAAARWLSAAGDLPLDVFAAYIPYDETREYVQRVVGNWARYEYLRGGEQAVVRLSLELPRPVELAANDY